MKFGRPISASKLNSKQSHDDRLTISSFKRPNSAKAQSLRQIIQVIQSTLSNGAQVVLSRTKSLEKFSKYKQHIDNTQKKKEKKAITRYMYPTPQFKTEFLISAVSNTSSVTNSSKTLNFETRQNEEFVPYMWQNGGKVECQNKKQCLQKQGSRRLQRRVNTVKAKPPKQKQLPLASIDRWQDEQTILNMSYLLSA